MNNILWYKLEKPLASTLETHARKDQKFFIEVVTGPR